jgi:periplasmic divalent cation tolerance protein
VITLGGMLATRRMAQWLKDFSRQLVKDGLCASAHNFAPVRSIYRWRSEIYERTKGRVSLHTCCSRVSEIVARAKKDHPYGVPGISTWPISDGNPEYLARIAKETAALKRSSTEVALAPADHDGWPQVVFDCSRFTAGSGCCSFSWGHKCYLGGQRFRGVVT